MSTARRREEALKAEGALTAAKLKDRSTELAKAQVLADATHRSLCHPSSAQHSTTVYPLKILVSLRNIVPLVLSIRSWYHTLCHQILFDHPMQFAVFLLISCTY